MCILPPALVPPTPGRLFGSAAPAGSDRLYARCMLPFRVAWWDSRRKKFWPLIDIIGAIYFPLLLVSDRLETP